MPLYEYECPKDGLFELVRKFADPPLSACPTWGGRSRSSSPPRPSSSRARAGTSPTTPASPRATAGRKARRRAERRNRRRRAGPAPPPRPRAEAGRKGGFAPLLDLVTQPDGSPRNWAYFWLTGSLSSYLDNAPTYLVFFNLAGGDAQQLMGPLAQTLTAISAGAVFMGAHSYIGNAPNFMVTAICEERGIRMPSFFGYQWWAFLLLFPLFVLLTFLFFI